MLVSKQEVNKRLKKEREEIDWISTMRNVYLEQPESREVISLACLTAVEFSWPWSVETRRRGNLKMEKGSGSGGGGGGQYRSSDGTIK
jgi:hypothetical protein